MIFPENACLVGRGSIFAMVVWGSISVGCLDVAAEKLDGGHQEIAAG